MDRNYALPLPRSTPLAVPVLVKYAVTTSHLGCAQLEQGSVFSHRYYARYRDVQPRGAHAATLAYSSQNIAKTAQRGLFHSTGIEKSAEPEAELRYI